MTPDFWSLVCQAMGFALTPWRQQFFDEWARWENTTAQFNPLATTQPGNEDPANPHFNSNGGNPVRNYDTFMHGAAQTARTITNGYYPDVVAALTEQAYAQPRQARMVSQINTWGTAGFANRIDYGWRPDATNAQPEEDDMTDDQVRAIARALIDEHRAEGEQAEITRLGSTALDATAALVARQRAMGHASTLEDVIRANDPENVPA